MINYDENISINASMDNIGRAMFGNAPISQDIILLMKEVKELQKAKDKGTITEEQKIRYLQIREILQKNEHRGF